ncbi:MAG: hypothetical protein COT34_00925 [Candidatus Nealsonbacteria bacterium CG08_land_8_20_14_0_20_43_11]|uniref:Uncharacterized protein n=1 Tax=Candidatus Nealsonbacteria bacterium CG08_land_8_20_14_0_20_43_11 TaxID=1974706 RepID=A0A2M6T144_9BACT|nr:MAG: hypothetical protein COT34_00925 [Candidatus Nealsonbacteria bacterium CG08_land_8_20_14_0_20_43_11]
MNKPSRERQIFPLIKPRKVPEDISMYLSIGDQKRLRDLRQSLGDLQEVLKNPLQFIKNEAIGQILQKLTDLYKKGKEAREKCE